MGDQDNFLRPLRGKPKRVKFAVVDIESKDGLWTDQELSQEPGFTRPFLAGYYDGEQFLSFRGPDAIERMVAFLLDPARDGWRYYAHFGGSFDWLHFLPEIVKTGYHFELLTVSSSIQMLTVKRKADSHRKGWAFLDSYKLIPIGLGKATKAFNVATPKMQFDLKTHEDDPGWDEYNRIDNVGLYEVLVRFHELVEERLGGEVGVTTASTSMRTFRRKYQKAPIYRHKRHHEFFRQAYYGGRVERIVGEMDGLHYYDFNSAYPYVMQAAMPIGKLYTCEGTPFAATTGAGTRIGFAHVSVRYPEDINFPVLPYRHNGRLCFPVGHFSGVWSAAEIYEAEEQGAEITWNKSVWIDSGPIFAEMVDELYQYRDKSRPGYDAGLAQTVKILLNSLYGKWGMNTEREKIIFLEEDQEPPEGAKPCDPFDPDCRLWLVKELVDAPYIAPQVAAHITALSRLHLHRLIITAEELGQVAYYDTDSVLTTADLSSLCSSKLGGLKDEGLGLTYKGVFLQPKLYSLEANESDALALPPQNLAALAGVSAEEAAVWIAAGSIPPDKAYFLRKLVMKGYKERNAEAFDNVRNGGIISYKSLEKIGALARVGFKRGPQMRMVTRQIRKSDEKRKFEGNYSRPIYIDEKAGYYGEDEDEEDE